MADPNTWKPGNPGDLQPWASRGRQESPDGLSYCRRCRGSIQFLDSPTGSWWAHDVHPEDDHDAIPLHNHFTRDIKSPGKCGACDDYHRAHPRGYRGV